MNGKRKYTRGPWYVDRAQVRPTQEDLLAIYAANGDKLAILTDDPTFEWRANAQLMAAAPELLVGAEAALDLLIQNEDWLAERTYNRSSVVIARLQAIITKATSTGTQE